MSSTSTAKQFGVLALVGGVLGSLLNRAVTPFIAGAVIYVLGYWVRGRPETQKLLATVSAWKPTFPGSGVFTRVSTASGQAVTQVAASDDGGNLHVLDAAEVEALSQQSPVVQQAPVPNSAGPVGTASGETFDGAGSYGAWGQR